MHSPSVRKVPVQHLYNLDVQMLHLNLYLLITVDLPQQESPDKKLNFQEMLVKRHLIYYSRSALQ